LSDLRGIEADFATWRPVQGRKVLQLVFEVPLENTQHVLDMLGIPQPGESKWCAIALLRNGSNAGERSNSKAGNTPSASGAFSEKIGESAPSSTPSHTIASSAENGTSDVQANAAKKPWSEYSRSQQAFILIRDPAFRDYFDAADQSFCDKKLKQHLRIASKSELDDPSNHSRWDEFVALYHLHRDRLR
jgi:hypothetical protein